MLSLSWSHEVVSFKGEGGGIIEIHTKFGRLIAVKKTHD